jgi:hypothetical protein
LYFVVDDRRVWQKLSNEVRNKFKAKEDITGPSTAALPYLNAVVHESKILYLVTADRSALRMRPVAAAGGPRETPLEGAMIAGRYIPGNVTPLRHL